MLPTECEKKNVITKIWMNTTIKKTIEIINIIFSNNNKFGVYKEKFSHNIFSDIPHQKQYLCRIIFII